MEAETDAATNQEHLGLPEAGSGGRILPQGLRRETSLLSP